MNPLAYLAYFLHFSIRGIKVFDTLGNSLILLNVMKVKIYMIYSIKIILLIRHFIKFYIKINSSRSVYVCKDIFYWGVYNDFYKIILYFI